MNLLTCNHLQKSWVEYLGKWTSDLKKKSQKEMKTNKSKDKNRMKKLGSFKIFYSVKASFSKEICVCLFGYRLIGCSID